MAYAATILKDSVSPEGRRLTTFEITFPRFVLAEFNTHRVLSRNSASSRAIPVEKRIASVEADPFVPEAFGKNQKGMQASEILDVSEATEARTIWMQSCSLAIEKARRLAEIGVHKQLANRILEPFLWHTVIVSATEWSNFFALRCHKDAQPEIRRIAEMMRELYRAERVDEVDSGTWHRPLLTDQDQLEKEGFSPNDLNLISVGRCARVSYLTHDGIRDPKADIALAKRLQVSGHMSPFEHVAQANDYRRYSGNFFGWDQYRKFLPNEADFSKVSGSNE